MSGPQWQTGGHAMSTATGFLTFATTHPNPLMPKKWQTAINERPDTPRTPGCDLDGEERHGKRARCRFIPAASTREPMMAAATPTQNSKIVPLLSESESHSVPLPASLLSKRILQEILRLVWMRGRATLVAQVLSGDAEMGRRTASFENNF